jgi:hypothetical protein
VNNGFDDPYRIAYTSTNNGAFLKLENVGGSIIFYIQGGLYCDEEPYVDFIFVVNGVDVKFNRRCVKSNSNDVVFFTADLVNGEMYESFKKCSLIKIRINEDYCGSEIYTFNMNKSTSALNYMINQ